MLSSQLEVHRLDSEGNSSPWKKMGWNMAWGWSDFKQHSLFEFMGQDSSCSPGQAQHKKVGSDSAGGACGPPGATSPVSTPGPR